MFAIKICGALTHFLSAHLAVLTIINNRSLSNAKIKLTDLRGFFPKLSNTTTEDIRIMELREDMEVSPL